MARFNRRTLHRLSELGNIMAPVRAVQINLVNIAFF